MVMRVGTALTMKAGMPMARLAITRARLMAGREKRIPGERSAGGVGKMRAGWGGEASLKIEE